MIVEFVICVCTCQYGLHMTWLLSCEEINNAAMLCWQSALSAEA